MKTSPPLHTPPPAIPHTRSRWRLPASPHLHHLSSPSPPSTSDPLPAGPLATIDRPSPTSPPVDSPVRDGIAPGCSSRTLPSPPATSLGPSPHTNYRSSPLYFRSVSTSRPASTPTGRRRALPDGPPTADQSGQRSPH